ncbi:MAG: cytochrome b [Pseudomonadota bacterium]
MMNSRYHSIAILLHWLTALGVFALIGTGLYMVNIDISRADQFKLYQWHKAAGVVVLNLVILRMLVRLFVKPPRLPQSLSADHQRIAGLGHIVLYAALFMIPISGWFMVSASPFGLPTFVFVDWIKWPHIPFVERNETVETIANWTHMLLAYTAILLILGHILAVFYHKRTHQLNLLRRMWWSREQ